MYHSIVSRMFSKLYSNRTIMYTIPLKLRAHYCMLYCMSYLATPRAYIVCFFTPRTVVSRPRSDCTDIYPPVVRPRTHIPLAHLSRTSDAPYPIDGLLKPPFIDVRARAPASRCRRCAHNRTRRTTQFTIQATTKCKRFAAAAAYVHSHTRCASSFL